MITLNNHNWLTYIIIFLNRNNSIQNINFKNFIKKKCNIYFKNKYIKTVKYKKIILITWKLKDIYI